MTTLKDNPRFSELSSDEVTILTMLLNYDSGVQGEAGVLATQSTLSFFTVEALTRAFMHADTLLNETGRALVVSAREKLSL